MARTMQTATTDRDGHEGSPSLATGVQPSVPARRLPKTVRILVRGDRRSDRRLRAAVPPRRACRCSSRASRPRPTSSTAPRRCSAWSSSASCSAPASSTGPGGRTCSRCSAGSLRARRGGRVINVAQGRPARAIPHRLGKTELAAFVILPALLPLIFGGQLGSAATTVAANLLILALIYAIFVFGLLAIVRWVFARLAGQLRSSLGLLAKAVPLLAIFALLSFASQEMWQIFATLSDFAYVCTIGLFVVLGTRLPRRPRSARGAAARARGVPTDRRSPAPSGSTSAWCCSSARRCRCCSSASSSAPSSSSSGCSRSTRTARESWIGTAGNVLLTVSLGGDEFELTEELLRVAGGLAAFSGFYFAVAMLTDSTYREEFLEELTDGDGGQLQGAHRLPRAAGRGAMSAPTMIEGYRHRPGQPLRLDRAAQPARLRRDRDLRGDGARARRRASASTTCSSTASRRRGSPTAGSAGSRSSSSSSPARRSPSRPSTTPASPGRPRARRSTPAARRCCSPTSTTSTTTASRRTSPATRWSSPATTTRSPTSPTPASSELQTTRLENLARGAPRHAPGLPARRSDAHRARPAPSSPTRATAARPRDRAQREARCSSRRWASSRACRRCGGSPPRSAIGPRSSRTGSGRRASATR